MGERLSKPIREKEKIDGSTTDLEFGICTMQGYRITMEDAFFYSTNLIPDTKMSIFGICDGHGGKEVSTYISNHFIEYLLKNENFKNKNYEKALRETFLLLDKSLLTEEAKKELYDISKNDRIEDDKKLENLVKNNDIISNNNIEKMKVFKNLFDPHNLKNINISSFCGSTCCTVLITEDKLYIANAGDSRCIILNQKGEIIYKTTDHKCTEKNELKRIEQADGFLEGNRIKGSLDVSRGFGDLEHKQCKWLKLEDQAITPNPEINALDIDNVFYLVIGCDGFFDPTHKDEVNLRIANFIVDGFNNNKNGSQIVGEYIDLLVKDDLGKDNNLGTDNCSAIVIRFLNKEKKQKEKKEEEKKEEEKKEEEKKEKEKKEEEKKEEEKKEEEKKEEEKKEEEKKEEEKKEEEKKEEVKKEEETKEEETKEEVKKEEEKKEEEKKEEEKKEEETKDVNNGE